MINGDGRNGNGFNQVEPYRRSTETMRSTMDDKTMRFQETFPEESPAQKSWLSRSWKWILIAAASLLVIAAVAIGVFVILGGREKTLYQWSASERLDCDVRVERQLDLKKNAEGSPYRFTVRLLITNVGTEELAEVNLEEDLPEILVSKGDIVFMVEPTKQSEDGRIVGWTEKAPTKDEAIEIAYYLDLQAELSEPQLRKIEGQFEGQKIAFIGIPEKMITCQACAGSGRTNCAVCLGNGSITCPKCGGSPVSTCSKCGGDGKVECPVCKGYGYYCRCYYCGSPWPVGSSSCPNCGGLRYYT